uniref:Glycosyl transferase family 25 domain-containing protein n=1 Tax=viral metagenome TaxID=1070528 RepID=A0A6C0JLR6_9ZZZZ
MKIFVIHYKKLIDRKVHILEQFKKYNITDYEFIEIDRDELYNQDISMFQTNFSNSQIAISLSHFYAYKQIRDKYKHGLIFEDDIILSDDFINIFKKYISQLPINYDMLFLGDGCNLHIEKDKLIHNKYIYEKGLYSTNWGGDGSTRCTDSYLVSKNCATKICEYINNLSYKIDLPVDWWLNLAARDNNLKVYWSEPTIVTQGTQNGLYTSSH